MVALNRDHNRGINRAADAFEIGYLILYLMPNRITGNRRSTRLLRPTLPFELRVMRKNHMIALALGLAATLLIIFGFFGINMENPLVSLFGMVGVITCAVAAIMIGSTEPSDSGDHH